MFSLHSQNTNVMEPRIHNQTPSSSFTLISQILGSCILSVPFVVQRIGWVASIIILLHSYLSMSFTIYYYTKACYYTQAKSYKDLVRKIMGKKFASILNIALITSYLGFMTGYIIIAASSVKIVMNHLGFTANNKITEVVISICIIFPLCLLKSLKTLSYCSIVASLAILLFICSVVAYFFGGIQTATLCTYSTDSGPQSINYEISMYPQSNMIQSILQLVMYIPTLHAYFSVHPTIPRLLTELHGPNELKYKIVQKSTQISLLTGLICFSIVGFMGATMFGTQITQNILQGFKLCKFVWMDVLSIIYALVVIINFPLVLYPLKTSLIDSFNVQINTRTGYFISITISAAFIVVALSLAMFLEQIVTLFGLFASVTGIFICLLVPLYCYIIIDKLKDHQLQHPATQSQLEHNVDGVKTAILSVISGSTHGGRKFTNQLFGSKKILLDEDEPLAKNYLSVVDDTGVEMHNYTIVNATPEQSQTSQAIEIKQDEWQQPKGMFRSVKFGRKFVGVFFIALYACICIEGAVMNALDIAAEYAK